MLDIIQTEHSQELPLAIGFARPALAKSNAMIGAAGLLDARAGCAPAVKGATVAEGVVLRRSLALKEKDGNLSLEKEGVVPLLGGVCTLNENVGSVGFALKLSEAGANDDSGLEV